MDAKNRRHESEDLDRWLDLALQERANAEPRSGLEERVLARLATEPPKRQFVWWQVWAAVAAIFVIALTLTLIYPRHQDQVANQQSPAVSPAHRIMPREVTTGPRQPTGEARAASGSNAACCFSKGMVVRNRPTAVHAQLEPLPQLATFPAPRPETAQERVLARLTARRGSYELAGASPDMVPLKDLSIPELKIEPMEGTPSDETPHE